MINKAINLFLENSKYKKENILKIKQIHSGFTNVSFLFKTDDKKKYQVRLGGANDIVNRKNEFNILKAINDINYIFIDKDGNAIKKWINGINPKFFFNKKKLLNLLILEIMKLHKTNIKDFEIINHDYLSFFDKTIFFDQFDKDMYLKLINKYKNLDLVLSHNDINPKNMIYDYKSRKIILIDYEWGRINNKYWDVANFFRETNLNIKWLDYMLSFYTDLDKKIMYEFLYLCTNFAYQWTFGMKETKKILNYRKKIKVKLMKYRKYIS